MELYLLSSYIPSWHGAQTQGKLLTFIFNKLESCSASQEILHYYRTWRLINIFTKSSHCTLSWTNSIQSISLNSISLNFILILPSHLWLNLSSCLSACISHLFHVCYMSHSSHTPLFSHFAFSGTKYWNEYQLITIQLQVEQHSYTWRILVIDSLRRGCSKMGHVLRQEVAIHLLSSAPSTRTSLYKFDNLQEEKIRDKTVSYKKSTRRRIKQVKMMLYQILWYWTTWKNSVLYNMILLTVMPPFMVYSTPLASIQLR